MKAIYFALIFALFSCKETVKMIRPATLTSNPLLSKMDSTVQKAFNDNSENLDSPGISIGILKDGKTTFYGYGETVQGNGIVPNENTFFEIGSITKTFTAIAIAEMLLSEQKTIETPIRGYLPSDLPTLQRGGIEVNFKHLLTHTAGLARMPNNMWSAADYATYDNEKLYQYLKNVQLESIPFTRSLYSNTGFGILGNILERHYKTSYNDLIKRHLLSPLNLNDTKVDFEDTDVTRWAVGYKNGKKADYWKSLNALNGAGVLKSTTKDLILYAKANLSPPDNTLGSAIKLTHQKTYGDANGDEGLAWAFSAPLENSKTILLWHNGGTGGFESWLFINEKNNSALVVLFNANNEESRRAQFISALTRMIID